MAALAQGFFLLLATLAPHAETQPPPHQLTPLKTCSKIFKNLLGDQVWPDALHAARYNQVTLATKEIGGKERVVVLLGEQHVKSENAYKATENFVNHFDHFGLEGANNLVMKIINLDKLYEEISRKTGTKGSAIRSVRRKAISDQSLKVYPLEEGHRAGLREQAEVFRYLVCLKAICAALPFSHQLKTQMTSAMTSRTLRRPQPGSPTKGALLDDRNNTMFKNLMALLTKHKEIEKIMVIVGAGHVSGLEELLENEGFALKAKL